VGEELLDWIDGEGMPVVFEATGVPDVMSLGFKLTASGGRLVLLGLLPQGTEVAFDGLDVTRKEATILGSRASTGCFPEAIDLLANGGLLYPDVATVLPMWDGPEIFSNLSKDPGLLQKAVLVT
jgi:L-gulonate 5-dehydrogenase